MLGRSKRHFKRHKEIASILAKHGWGWLLERTGVADYIGKKYLSDRSETAPTHLREILEELGPTFVKMGQLLSTRPDIIPEAYIKELVKLQDTAPELDVSEIYSVIETELESNISFNFSEFSEKSIAAGSLAQVHKARLLDGTQVIVKVQRPGIRDTIETDIEILYKRAKYLENKSEKARTYGIADIVDEFSSIIREELDYTREARNTDRLREVIGAHKNIKVPHVHWHLTTTKILTLEMMEGVKITELSKGIFPNINRRHIVSDLASTFLEQVFVHKYFHADPHPGNILVNENGEILLVDCGQIGRLDAAIRAGIVKLLLAFEEQDSRAFADEIMDIGAFQDEINTRKYSQDISKVLREYYDQPAVAVNMGLLFMRVLDISAKYKIRLPVSFAVIGKVFANLEGICRQIDPEFNFTEAARSYVGKAVRSELKSESTISELYRAIGNLRAFILAFPEQLERLMRKAVEGSLRVEFKHQGLEHLADTLSSSANRISMALIIGSIIVGSSLVTISGNQGSTSWFGLPVVGLFGYIVACVFGVWLIISIIKSGKQK